MDTTQILALPYLQPDQALKHITHNEALRMLDALVQLSVIDRDRTIPPAEPADGDRHIIAAGAEDEWSGRDGQIAARQDGAWSYYVPAEGWRVWVAAEAALTVFYDADWGPMGLGPANAETLGINATADETNRLAVASPAVLFSHDGDGHQVKINKAAPADTASLLFQSGFSGRAEMGLAGDDDFHVKVSDDGAAWHEALVIAAVDGATGFPGGIRLGGETSDNQLDDYETGTFTLTLGSTLVGDYAAATGITQTFAHYTLVGKTCFVRVAFNVDGVAASDLAAGSCLHLRGLPFSVADLSPIVDQFAAGAVYRSIGSALNTLLGGYTAASDNFYLFTFALATNNAKATDRHYATFSYEIA